MGEAAGASGASVASLGLSVASSVIKGQGQKSSYDFQADRAQRAAAYGKLQAGLTDVTFRDRLNTTLANIDVIRGAARIDPTSPTTAVLREREGKVSDRQRTAAVMTQRAQAAEDEAGADYLRQAGDYALSLSYLDAGIKLSSGIAKGAG